MYLAHTPDFIQHIFPDLTWKIPTDKPSIFLTFDDGPVPEVTPWVLDTLAQFNAKASFFCVGENVNNYPTIFKRLEEEGHTVGNHTYNHLSGWSTDNVSYLRNVRKGARMTKSTLFRPPYGKLRPSQARFLKYHYDIIMWDVLSGDFDPELSKEACLSNVCENSSSGSIIVFHDSIKSFEKLKFVLPNTLEYFSRQNYSFESIKPMKRRNQVLFSSVQA
ncbi:MAG: polysaccharide deacetylase family protein [Bacteroidota bacterium]|nr:polysaccharide deacetylase family protein [Bacteroidota bacterium]